MIDRSVLEMIMTQQREANERMDKIQNENAARTAMAAFHAVSEMRQGAESAQSHMSMQPIMMAAMSAGNTANAAALAYQMNGASAMRTEHASRHLQLQQQLASGLAPPTNTAKPDKPETPEEARSRLMPDLSLFSVPSQQQQPQQQHQQQQQYPMVPPGLGQQQQQQQQQQPPQQPQLQPPPPPSPTAVVVHRGAQVSASSLNRAEAYTQMKRYERRLKNMIKDGMDEASIEETETQLGMYKARYYELLDLDSDDDGSDSGGGSGGGGGGMITNGAADDDGAAADVHAAA
jgi:hypothetical protein